MLPGLVSVVVPVYNMDKFVGQSIDSILAQTYSNFEIVVVDDGSTDRTPDVIKKFGNSVRYIRQENKGLSAARNTAIRNAQGEIIALLDADDLWDPPFLEKMINLLNRYPDACAAYCGYRYIDEKGNIEGKPQLKIVPPEEFYRAIITGGNWLVPASVIFRKKILERVGLFDEELSACEDADLWIRISALFPMIGLPEVLVRYRRHSNNMSNDPSHMIAASYQQKYKMFGSPDGDISSWSELKLSAYTALFQSAAIRYLAYGDIEKTAQYFKQLTDISPGMGLSMSLWRKLARAHLTEIQKNSNGPVNWVLAQRDIENLLDKLATEITAAPILQKQFLKIKGHAILALADELGRSKYFFRSLYLLVSAIRFYPFLTLSRSYWGTFVRTILFSLRR